MSRTVRRFAVTTSPTFPLPRVAPSVSTPSRYVRAIAAPSILSSAEKPASSTFGPATFTARSYHPTTSSSENALANDPIGTRCSCFSNASAGAAPTRSVGESSVRSSGCAASSCCSSRNSRSYSASASVGRSSV